jgi:putative membrane protein
MPGLHPVSALTVAVLGALSLAACERRDEPFKAAGPAATAPAAPGTAAPPAAPPAVAAPADRPAENTVVANDADRSFVEQAGSSGMAEVEITRHTMDKAASAELKKVAEHLHRDHAQANQELMRIAAKKGIPVPREPAADKQAEIESLAKLSGAELDRAVVGKLAAAHRASIKLYEQQAAGGGDADLKAFAEKTLPTLREHLKMVEGMKSAGAEPAAVEPAPQAAAKKE